MNHQDHVRLIEKGIGGGSVWADIGSGTGAFTKALLDVLDDNAEVYSFDSDKNSLEMQKKEIDSAFPTSHITYICQDFTSQLDLPPLDGILAANAIHFVPDTVKTLKHVRQYLKPHGRLLVVEYNTDSGNHWVPYPFSYTTFTTYAKQAGFTTTQLLDTIPSQFLGEIYAAVAYAS